MYPRGAEEVAPTEREGPTPSRGAARRRRGQNGCTGQSLAVLTLLFIPLPLSCGGDPTPQHHGAGQAGTQAGGTSSASGGTSGFPAMGGSTEGTASGGTSAEGTIGEELPHECICSSEFPEIPIVSRPTDAECAEYCAEQEAAARGAGGSLGTGGDGGGETPQTGDSANALAALQEWLMAAPGVRTTLDTESFATVALTADDAQTAKDLLWNDLADQIRLSRQDEVDAKSITLDDFTLNYETVLLGEEPPDGRSLFISMHGGGSAPKETNDEQWQNQIQLAQSYAPEDALWVAPRAPTDDWNMWFKDHIVPLFDRLISNMIVFEDIHPNKVYLTGYSAGGDGVYQLGPTIADRWAGAAMSAGHPNDMTPVNLRNIPFAIHVGGDDTAFDRNLVAAEWGEQLDALQAADPEGYPHQVEVHPGLPHWMNLADQPSIPFIQSSTRNIYPSRVVWRQSTFFSETRFYWLELTPEQAADGAEVTATLDDQTINLETDISSGITVLLSDEMLDLDREVRIELDGNAVFEGTVPRTILTIHRSLAQREDPAATFSAAVSDLP